MKNRKRWLNELYVQYARLMDDHGMNSALARACIRWSDRDPEVRDLFTEARLLKVVFGSALRSRWKLKS